MRSLLLLTFCAVSMQVLSQSVIAPNAKLELVSSQFKFTEGASVDKAGNVYFTDQPNNTIWKYDTKGKLSLFRDNAGRSNGTYVDKNGNLITCADENGQIWSIDKKGKETVILKNFQGHQFNGPNDLWIDPKGGIYFTDPYFQRDYWTRKGGDPAMKKESLYYLAKGKSEPVVVDDQFTKPNGVVGTPDGKHLYAAEIAKGTIYKYDIQADGSLTNRTAFVEDRADGITLDNKGNVYLAGKGVTVYDPSGKKIEHIDVPSKWTANLCLGGKDKDVLFITASESVYTIKMAVKGVE
ncbi:MAG TPA: SMP-30/gluconolactonase/LRE family protein [Cyclobacteriaceae bacterium]